MTDEEARTIIEMDARVDDLSARVSSLMKLQEEAIDKVLLLGEQIVKRDKAYVQQFKNVQRSLDVHDAQFRDVSRHRLP